MRLAHVSLAVSLGLLAGAPASGQDFPSRPITIVVPFGPGGTDTYARLLAPKMTEKLGHPTIIENVGGAGGSIGALRVATAKPDGHTLLMGNLGTQVLNAGLDARLRYDPRRDFAPVSLVANDHLTFVVKKETSAANLREFVAHLRANPGKVSFSTAGAGSVSHVSCALLLHQNGVTTTHVPYKAFAAAMQDVIRGEVDFTCGLPGTVKPFIEAGSLKGFAFTGPTRSPLLPSVPTTAEAGFPSYLVNSWNALFAPKGTPRLIVEKLNAAVRENFDDPEIQKKFVALGAIVPKPEERNPEHLARLVEADLNLWLPIMKSMALTRD